MSSVFLETQNGIKEEKIVSERSQTCILRKEGFYIISNYEKKRSDNKLTHIKPAVMIWLEQGGEIGCPVWLSREAYQERGGSMPI
ncbi:MAG: hypothetical protein AB2693_33920 [Candidatus Thiodiazotropha sp.]